MLRRSFRHLGSSANDKFSTGVELMACGGGGSFVDCGAVALEDDLHCEREMLGCTPKSPDDHRIASSRCAASAGKLKKSGCSSLLVTQQSGEVWCPLCDELCASLIANDGCCHVACESCWLREAAEQVKELSAHAFDLRVRQLCVRCPQSGVRNPSGDTCSDSFVRSHSGGAV